MRAAGCSAATTYHILWRLDIMKMEPSQYMATTIPALSTAVLALAIVGTTAQAADRYQVELREDRTEFLHSTVKRSVLSGKDPLLPQFCARGGCPPVVSTSPWQGPDEILPGYLPHVRVSFYVDEITNVPVKNGGVGSSKDEPKKDEPNFVEWVTDGSPVDDELGGPYGWALPGPGETYDEFGPHAGPSGLRVYDALVFNACGSFASFDVAHDAVARTLGGEELGSFNGVDNSTIDSTGYYNINYTIRATDENGGVSDFRFSGTAAAICSGLNSL